MSIALRFRKWLRLPVSSLRDYARLERQMNDYAEVGLRLFWQRQMIFGVALLLAAFYYSLPLAALNLILIIINETYDYSVFQHIVKARKSGRRLGAGPYWAIVVGTTMSAGIIGFFALWITILQGYGSHFMPLFFLFAAGVFAAMNNHQLPSILALRLAIYGVVFITISVRDIVLTGAEIGSELWVQLFSSLFVAYFIVDCSRIFLAMYRTNLDRLVELERQNRRVEAALAAKTAFLSTMSHELRTPLTSISASLDLALSEKLGAVAAGPKKVLEIAQRNSKTLRRLIDDILDLQKASAGKLELNLVETDVVALTKEAISVHQPYAEQFGSLITCSAMPDEIVARVDPQRIEQVLSNLLSNAAKFSPPDSEIGLHIRLQNADVRIEICDQGIGLDEALKDKVFAPFTQLDGGDDRKVNGTGLGLSISKEFVTAHGGSIDYQRRPTGGTMFIVTLPVSGPRG